MPALTRSSVEELCRKIGLKILVKLKNGRSLRGNLAGFDKHLNLVLEEAEDVTRPENVEKIGNLILRGDNIVLIYLEA